MKQANYDIEIYEDRVKSNKKYIMTEKTKIKMIEKINGICENAIIARELMNDCTF